MSQFAKLFETKVGEVLCVLDMNGENDAPEITFTASLKTWGFAAQKLRLKTLTPEPVAHSVTLTA